MAKHDNYKDLKTCAIARFIAPAGNEIVERIFSLVTAINTRPRKMTQIKLPDALVRIRSHLLCNAVSCKDIECTANMMKLPNSVDLYGQDESSSINDDKTEYIEGMLEVW